MGGTTAKASMVEDGEVTRARGIFGRRRHHDRLAAADGRRLHPEGAGDRSGRGRRRRRLAVWIDGGGALQIGPESAGALPGPVCYDKGGETPTVTDANVVLGYINPGHLVGGALTLNADKARAAFEDKDRGAARACAREGGLRRAPDRRLQHDPRHQGGVDRARPRSARIRAVRLRRQRPAVRLRHGGGARA